MTEHGNEEVFFEVRCSVCNRILFEVTDATSGTVKKKCDKCKMMRHVRLPLTRRAQASSISPDADPRSKTRAA